MIAQASGPIVRTAARPDDARHLRIAQMRRRFGQRVEHRLQVEGGTADHLEHVGGGGLLREQGA